jgi:hypothetical protein
VQLETRNEEHPSVIDLRRGSVQDIPFMRSMLTYAYNWHVNALDIEIPSTRYLDGWGRPGDVAFVALDNGHRVGAGWYRLFDEDSPGYGFLDDQTPEVTIAAVPSCDPGSILHVLLAGLLAQGAGDGYPGLSVSIERNDPAVAIYVAAGFGVAREHDRALTLRRSLN